MPPKSKTVGQKSKTVKNRVPKSGGTRKSEDRLERSVAPNSTLDPSNRSVNKELQQREKKELISSFQEQLDIKQSENEREIIKTLEKIKYLRKDNDRMQRRQIAEYGMTLDMLDELKDTLDSTKASNDKLHEDMVEAKTLHDKLEVELKETQQRYSDALQKINDLHKETKVWQATKEQFLRSEERCTGLTRNNKKLRIILLKHHIDPNADPREYSRENQWDKQSVKTARSHPEPLKPKLTVRSRYQSIGNVEMMKQLNEEDLKRGTGVLANTFDQISPAYLGYYMKRREAKREQVEYFRPGMNLPKIIYGK